MIKNAVEPAPESISLSPTIDQLRAFFHNEIEEISSQRLTSSTYYACMLIRCNAIAKLPLKLMKETGNGSVKAVEHPSYMLLHKRPNQQTTLHDFLWATEFQRLEYGNAFWLPVYQNGVLDGVYLLDSLRVQIMIDDQSILGKENSVYYLYNDPKRGQIIFTRDELLHFKNFSKNGIVGTSIKKYMSDVIESEQYARKIIKNKNRTGLQDPVVVHYSGDLNSEKRNKIQKKFAEIGGAKNAGKVIPLPIDFDIKQLETKLVSNQFFQLQGLTTRQIANAFGVKSFQLNDMEKSTYNNIEQQNRAFYSDTLQNVLTEYEQEMDYILLKSNEKKYYWQFNVDAILRSDIESRYRAYQIGISGAFLQPAEARAKENLPFVEGTDELFFGNGAVIPLKQAGKQYESNRKEGGGTE